MHTHVHKHMHKLEMKRLLYFTVYTDLGVMYQLKLIQVSVLINLIFSCGFAAVRYLCS